jgi:hypothetical protein
MKWIKRCKRNEPTVNGETVEVGFAKVKDGKTHSKRVKCQERCQMEAGLERTFNSSHYYSQHGGIRGSRDTWRGVK